MPLSPFEQDQNATTALVNGQSASAGMGVPPAGGLPMPSSVPQIGAQAQANFNQFRQDVLKSMPAAPAPQGQIGYNSQTGQVQTADGVFSIDDMPAALKAVQTGSLNRPAAQLQPGFQPISPSNIQNYLNTIPDWKKELGASMRNYGAGFAAIGAAAGSDAALDKYKQLSGEADILSRASSAPKEFGDVRFGENFLPYIRQLGIQSVPYIAEAMVSGFGLGSMFKQGGVAAAKQFAEKAITNEANRLIVAAGQSGSRITMEQALEAAAENVGQNFARGAGVVAGTYPSSVGDILGNQYDQAQQFNLPAAAGLGVPYAGLNLMGLEGLSGGVGRMIPRGVGATGIAGNAARGAAVGGITMAGEGLNELGQEFANQAGRMAVDPTASMFSPDALHRYKESFIGGTLLGGLGGVPHGIHAAINPADPNAQDLMKAADNQRTQWTMDQFGPNPDIAGLLPAPAAPQLGYNGAINLGPGGTSEMGPTGADYHAQQLYADRAAYEQQQQDLAQRNQQQWDALNQAFDQHVVNNMAPAMTPPVAQPMQQVETWPQDWVHQPGQQDMFAPYQGFDPAEVPPQLTAPTITEDQTAPMFDAKGRPTMAAMDNTEAPAADVLKQAEVEFSIKSTPKRSEVLEGAARQYYNGQLDFDTMNSIVEQLRANKFKMAAETLATAQKPQAEPITTPPGAAATSAPLPASTDAGLSTPEARGSSGERPVTQPAPITSPKAEKQNADIATTPDSPHPEKRTLKEREKSVREQLQDVIDDPKATKKLKREALDMMDMLDDEDQQGRDDKKANVEYVEKWLKNSVTRPAYSRTIAYSIDGTEHKVDLSSPNESEQAVVDKAVDGIASDPTVAAALDSLEGSIEVYDGAEGEEGFTARNSKTGKYIVAVARSVLRLGPEEVRRVIAHELGHVMDDVAGERKFSSRPEMAVQVVGKGVIGKAGEVVREVLDVYKQHYNIDAVRHWLSYPIDSYKGESDPATFLQTEIFAKLVEAWHSPVQREYMRLFMPKAYKLMTEVHSGQVRTESAVSDSREGSSQERGARSRSNGEGKEGGQVGRGDRPGGEGGGERQDLSKLSDAAFAHLLASITGDAKHIKDLMELPTIPTTLRESMLREALRQRGLADPMVVQGELHFSKASAALDSGIRMLHENPTSSSAWETVKAAGLKLMNLWQIEDTFKKVLPSIGTFNRALKAMGNEKEELRREGDSVRLKFDALPKAMRDKVEKLLPMITRNEFATARQGKTVTLSQNGSKANEAFKEAHELWSGLDSQSKNVYRDIIEHVTRLRSEMIKSVEDRVKDKGSKGVSLMGEVLRKATAVRGDYFPLMRFGDHITVWKSAQFMKAEKDANAKEIERLKKSGDHYIVSAHETKGEANAALRELDKLQGGKALYHLSADYIRTLQGAAPEFVEKLNNLFAEKEDKTTREAIQALYIQSLPEFSSAKRNLGRVGVHGFDTDSGRVFASYVERTSSSIARMKHMESINQAMSAVENEARDYELGGGRSSTPKEVVNVLRRHWEALVAPKHVPGAWQTHLTNASYIWYLGMTPSFALTNLAQSSLISAPVIAARLNISNFRVQAALLTAMKDAFGIQKQWLGASQGNLWRKVAEGGPQFTRDPNTGKVSVDLSKVKGLKPDEKELVQHLYRQSLIDLTQEHDLGAIADGRNPKAQAAMRTLSMFAHHSEILNRIGTGLAAYRLAKTTMKENPTTFAERIIRDTHFDYSSEMAPLYFKTGFNPVAKLMFQFRKYQQAMLFLLGRNVATAIRGSGEERAEALRTLAGLMVMHGVAAGALGIPLANKIAALAAMAIGSDDDPWDEERVKAEFRLWLAELLGKDAAEVAANGILRAPGLRDVLPATMNERVGQGQIGDITRNLKSSNRETAKDSLLKSIGAMVAGPAGGLGGDLLTAWENFGKGETEKGFEYATPKFMRDMLKAERFGSEGVVNSRGVNTVPASKITAIDQFWQAMGFTPPDISEYYQGQTAVMNHEQALQGRKTELVTRYANATMKGDTETAARIRDEEMPRFNAENPNDPMRMKDLMSAVRSRRKEQINVNEQGISVNPRKPHRGDIGEFANVE